MKDKSDQELYDELYAMAKTLLVRDTTTEMIEKHLSQKTDDIVLITVVITEAKKDHYAQMRKEGIPKIAIGSVLIVVGFAITCLNFHSNKSFDFAMYGLTSFGILFVFWGLFKMLG
ncbi:MAG: hypothetical protein IT236_19355 [Bacteroidia bacterium]|nr:hypothetical protein [Bacteroidia bacterium]